MHDKLLKYNLHDLNLKNSVQRNMCMYYVLLNKI